MKCHDLEAYLTDYLEGDLDQARTDEMLDHIEGCEACRAEFQTYERQEERLGRFFKQQLAAVADAKNPLAEAAPSGERSPSAARPIRRLAWAAAAVLCLTAGVGGWSVYRRVVPAGQAALAEVKAVEGRVLALEGNAYQAIAPGAPVRQGQRLKVVGGGYLALELPDGNIIEARGGTLLTLLDFPDRLETAMDRGNVWAHLKTPPPKPFVIRTAHLTATAVGTVYNVEEGLDRSEVTVAEGEVLVESGGTQTSVSESETYSTLTGAAQTADAAAALWSRYKEDILALLPGGDATAPTETPQLVVQVAAAAAPLHAAVEYLPENTLYFLDVRDWRGVVEEFRATDYSALLQEESIRQWWEAVGARKILDEIRAETRILDVLGVVGMIEGELAVGVNADGHALLLADCGANELEIAARIESLLAGSAQTPDGAIPGEDLSAKIAEHVLVAGGLLILSSDPILTQATFDRVVNAQPTGFTQSAFYQKILRDVDDPRFIMAANLGGQIARIVDGLADESGAADIGHALDLLGLPSLDYLLLSPSFAGQGMNQAARLAFVEEGRSGAMDWLAEPAPMRGLDFLSPGIPFFASAIVRNPHQLCLDYLLYMQNTQPEQDFQRALRFVAQNEAFFNAFGGEVAVGIDRPILPVPNVKIAVEVADQAAFQNGLDQLLAALLAELEESGTAAVLETSEHKGRTIQTLVIDVARGGLIHLTPSWTFVDDFFVAGPGPQFVRDSIDVYDSGHSIANDSERLLPLLPTSSEMHFSLLVYQDIAQSIPALVQEKIAPKLGEEEKGLVPNLSFMQNYRAPGIVYAYARPTCVDVYFNAPGGIDLNFGMAVPMVANWLVPRLSIGQTVTRVAQAEVALEEMRGAVEKFETENGRLPNSLSEIAQPEGKYIDRVPADPFAPVSGQTLRLVQGPGAGQITIYSIGPDAMDDRGLVEYRITDQYDGPGDVFIRVPPDEAGAGDE